MLPEVLRLTPGARRSCHPTHPVVALGDKADWLVADHESCDSPQGDGTPFDKLVECDALVVRINTPAYPLCHRFQEIVQWPNLFTDRAAEIPCIDDGGRSISVTTKVYRKRVPFVMFMPAADPANAVAANIIDYPFIFETRENVYDAGKDAAAARQMLLSNRDRFEQSGSRRKVVYNGCPIDSFPAGETMEFAVAEGCKLIDEYRRYYGLDDISERLADGRISL